MPNISVDGYAVYTNNVPCGAFRGFGAPQAQFAAEIMVTRLAHALGIDPVEFRRRNIYREGSIEPTQQPLRRASAPCRCWNAASRRPRAPSYGRLGYDCNRPPLAGSRMRRRTRICAGASASPAGSRTLATRSAIPEQATATVELFGGGEIEHATVRVGAAEVGQGAHTILRQIAAEALGLPFEHPRRRSAASRWSPTTAPRRPTRAAPRPRA